MMNNTITLSDELYRAYNVSGTYEDYPLNSIDELTRQNHFKYIAKMVANIEISYLINVDGEFIDEHNVRVMIFDALDKGDTKRVVALLNNSPNHLRSALFDYLTNLA